MQTNFWKITWSVYEYMINGYNILVRVMVKNYKDVSLINRDSALLLIWLQLNCL